jgi:DNA-directed RNA polymerase subunit RPC12/RpoP
MARRTVTNETGIKRIEGIPYHDAWVSYICVQCKAINFVRIGQQLLAPPEALETCEWKCEYCGFVHSKQSAVPFENWDKEYRNNDGIAVQRFWEGFFRIATENPASYWKQCNVCTRILPFNAFSKHSGWGPLERQMECRSCKGAINAILNPKRTKEQMLESSVRRRVADLFLEGENETINIDELFERFGKKCFKTNVLLDINDRTSWAVDHILPSKYLYPLTRENAALLSKEANSNKRDKWPSEFYTNNELIALAKITGANLELISSVDPVINQNIDVNRGVERYLQVRETSGLAKRIQEIKKIVEAYELVDKLSLENKKLLGFL